MIYTPILLRLWRCLTQPDHPEPPPKRLPEQFPQRVDYLVHTEADGTRTELVRVHLDVAQHHICGTWPINELQLEESRHREVVRDAVDMEAINLLKNRPRALLPRDSQA